MSTPTPQRFTGCIPSVYSPSDHYLEPLAGALMQTLPANVDHRAWCSPVRDQGPTNSCTGYAWTQGAEYQRNKQGAGKPGYTPLVFSKRFNWARTRQREYGNAWTQNIGVSLREGMIVGANDGFPADDLWPEELDLMNVDPLAIDPAAAKARFSGQHHKLVTVRAVQLAPDAFRAALAQGFGLVVGFATNGGFWSAPGFADPPATRGMVDASNLFLDGLAHAVFVCGYRDDKRFITKNSMGSNFGDNGYFYIPESWFGPIIFEAWTPHFLKE